MTISALIDKIVSAIASAEGFFSTGTLPARLHNPGDLRPWDLKQVQDHGFLKFKTDAEGIAFLYRQIGLDIARGLSLRGLIFKYAPPADGNNTSLYLTETQRRTGIPDLDEPLWNYLVCEYLA